MVSDRVTTESRLIMKKSVGALTTGAAVVLGGLVMTSAPAEASQGCVDQTEFRNTRTNTGLLPLEYRYETHGRLSYQGSGYKTKTYRACYGGRYAVVQITYRHHHDAWRVEYKSFQSSSSAGVMD